MNDLFQLLTAWLGSLGFAALFHLRGKKLFYASLGGLFSWGIYLLCQHATESPYLCAFAASVLMTFYAEIMARVHKTPVTVFLVSAAIPLIPGAGLYRSVNDFMLREMELCAEQSLYTLQFAASMSAGITLTTLVFQIILGILPRHHVKSP